MRKRIITVAEHESVSPDQGWLDPACIAEVQVTSEDAAHPIESALGAGLDEGWRAAGPGKQTIRLVFSQPQPLTRISLEFVELHRERTQQYLLRWSADRGQSFQEIVRQQWNFSPRGATSEREDHAVDLPNVTVLELTITPEIGGGDAVASLARLRLA